MKRLTFIIAGLCCFQQSYADTSYSVEILNSVHPSKEPAGLFVVDFQVINNSTGNYNNFKYRIYCPTQTVRNITTKKKGDLRTTFEEDQQVFSNISVLQYDADNICQPAGNSHSALL